MIEVADDINDIVLCKKTNLVYTLDIVSIFGENKPLYLSVYTYHSHLNKHDGIDIDEYLKIPEMLKNTILIIDLNDNNKKIISCINERVYCIGIKNINDKNECFVTTLYYIGKYGQTNATKMIERLRRKGK